MSVGSEVGQEAVELFNQDTMKIFQANIGTWIAQLTAWMNKAAQLDAIFKMQNKYDWLKGSSSSKKIKGVEDESENTAKGSAVLENWGSSALLSSSYKSVSIQQASVVNDKQEENQKTVIRELLRSGYTLLNQIGESLRGEEILYNIVINTSGEKISSMNGKIYSFMVPFQEFIKMTGFSDQILTVKKYSDKYFNELMKGSTSHEQWSATKQSMFPLFMAQARALKNGNWLKINEGNALEGFKRFGEWATHALYSDKNYWGGIFVAMRDTMSKPDAFWQGGDIGNIQLKGYRASITNLNSLIINVKKALDILMKGSVTRELIKKYVKTSFVNSFDNDVEMATEEVVEKLLEMFTSSR